MKISFKNKILITEFNENYSPEAISIYKSLGKLFYLNQKKNFDKKTINAIVVGLDIQLNKILFLYCCF